jgi:hypothetical protein
MNFTAVHLVGLGIVAFGFLGGIVVMLEIVLDGVSSGVFALLSFVLRARLHVLRSFLSIRRCLMWLLFMQRPCLHLSSKSHFSRVLDR